MVEFRVIDPRGKIVATKKFASAEAAHAGFVDVIGDDSELGWRMEVSDEGEWATTPRVSPPRAPQPGVGGSAAGRDVG